MEAEGARVVVAFKDWKDTLSRLQKFGRSGRTSKSASLERVVDELSRQITELSKAVELLIRHNRFGPDWEDAFVVSWEDADPQNRVFVRHDYQYTPNHWIIVQKTNPSPSGSPAPANWGSLRLRTANSRVALFQLDDEAIANQITFKVILFRGIFTPPET